MNLAPRLVRCTAPIALATAALLSAGTAAAASYFYPFTSLTAGTQYVVGDSLTPAGSTVEFKQFQWWNGTWTATGFAEVDFSARAGAFPHELELNNINVRVAPDNPAVFASYRYAYLGGNVNIGVNGDLRNVSRPIFVNGDVVGGCDVTVTENAIPGGFNGSVEIDCPAGTEIDMFGVGGQEFWIDDVFFED